MKTLITAIGMFACVGSAHAFTVPTPTRAQQQAMKQQLMKAAKATPLYKLTGAGHTYINVREGFGPTPTGFIGTGLWTGTVTVRRGGIVEQRQYDLIGNKTFALGQWTRVPFHGPVVRNP
jgi:hypothetical protein